MPGKKTKNKMDKRVISETFADHRRKENSKKLGLGLIGVGSVAFVSILLSLCVVQCCENENLRAAGNKQSEDLHKLVDIIDRNQDEIARLSNDLMDCSHGKSECCEEKKAAPKPAAKPAPKTVAKPAPQPAPVVQPAPKPAPVAQPKPQPAPQPIIIRDTVRDMVHVPHVTEAPVIQPAPEPIIIRDTVRDTVNVGVAPIGPGNMFVFRDTVFIVNAEPVAHDTNAAAVEPTPVDTSAGKTVSFQISFRSKMASNAKCH